MNARLALILAVVECLGVVTFAHGAQQTPAVDTGPRTKLEAFQGQTGTVVVKGCSTIGRVSALGSVEVSAMEFADATTGRKQSGVVIEVAEGGRLETSDRSFIDYDEVDALLGGLDYIARATRTVTELGEFEATYKTKGNFRATTFSTKEGKIDAAVISGRIRSVTAYLSLEQLGEVRVLVAGAKAKLDSAK